MIRTKLSMETPDKLTDFQQLRRNDFYSKVLTVIRIHFV